MAQAESVGYLAAVAVGAVVGLLGRALLTSRPRLDRTSAVLCGIIGSALGFTALRVVPPLTAHGFPWLRLLLAALLGTLAVMATGQALHRSWVRRHPDLVHGDPKALIAAGGGRAWSSSPRPAGTCAPASATSGWSTSSPRPSPASSTPTAARC
ncbi:hypothetical protein ACFQZC_34585 [Streptacidiphilus monticola]